MSYHSRLAYDVWEQENYYADDDCSPPWEEPASASPSDQEEAAPLAA